MDKGIFKNILYILIALTVLSAIISNFAISFNFASGLLIGGIFSVINFLLLIFIVKKIFFGDPKTQMKYAFIFMFKLSFMGAVIYWLFNTNLFKLNKVGFLTGITLLFLTIILNSLIYGNKLNTEVN